MVHVFSIFLKKNDIFAKNNIRKTKSENAFNKIYKKKGCFHINLLTF